MSSTPPTLPLADADAVRRRPKADDLVWRRRRKTAPADHFAGHVDYHDAVSSLLWEPYECRDPPTASSTLRHDADVSLWLSSSASFAERPRTALQVSNSGEFVSVSSLRTQSRSGRCRDRMSAVCEPSRVSVNQGVVPFVVCNQVSVLACDSSGSASTSTSTNDLGCKVVVCPSTTSSGGDVGCNVAVGSQASPVGTAVSCAVSSTNLAVPSPNLTVQQAVTVCSVSVPIAQDVQVAVGDAARDARRRERRERRHQRRVNSSQNQLNASATAPVWTTRLDATPVLEQRLPDLLSAHLPPAYSTLPTPTPSTPAPHVAHVAPVDGRFPFQAAPANRRRLRRGGERRPKSCCGLEVTQTVSIRWFVVVIAFVGVCCAVVGTTLGAMEASGRDHLTVSLLMIGVGVVLVTVSGVAWRLTANEAPSCRAMLGLDRRGDSEGGTAEPNRRFVPRLPPSFGRPHHPYAAMLYPEFAYRPPPPSYAASMQEYRLRLLLDRHSPLSPPPQYRTGAGSVAGSRPPSYRGQAGQSGISVISVPGEAAVVDALKLSPESELPSEPAKSLVAGSDEDKDEDKEGNLVTIVSTGDVDAVVTVTTRSEPAPTTELDILAHL